MPTSKSFVSHIFAFAAEELSRSGFQKRRADIFTVALDEEVVGWLGLNKALHRGGVLQINPVVGVRHQKLESRLAELLGQKPHQYVPASISTNIGYLMPEREYVTWSFQENTSCEAPIAEMAAAIAKFARPWMKQNAILAALYSALLNSTRHSARPA